MAVRQYASTHDLEAAQVPLSREAARHIVTVLRLDVGGEVELFDGCGASAAFALAAADGPPAPVRALLREGRLVLRRTGEIRRVPRPAVPITLGACVSKGARMDWTIEKAVELGASRIVPIASDNCVVRFSGAPDSDAHRERWARIATEAARQCGAAYLPEIAAPVPLEAALRSICTEGCAAFAGGLVPDAVPFRAALDAVRAAGRPRSAAWLVGPEGDFSGREYDILRKAGATLVSLGSLVLRTETAAMAGLCILSAEWP